jgi:hypothetical protein
LDCGKATGAERLEWDRRSCTNIFEVLDNNSRRDHETAEMSEEEEKNHENLIEDNIAKNLQWMVGRSHGEISDRNKIPSEIKRANWPMP